MKEGVLIALSPYSSNNRDVAKGVGQLSFAENSVNVRRVEFANAPLGLITSD